MANNYYNFTTPFIPGTKVRSEQVNTQLGGVESGFDLLPTDPVSSIIGTSWFATETQGASVNEFLITSPDPQSSLSEGQRTAFRATHTNDGPATLNVDGTGLVAAARFDKSALGGGEIVSGQYYEFIYDSASTLWLLTAATDASLQVSWAQEWANKAVGSLISTAAGGDGVSDYSALHWGQGAEEWAIRAEDDPVPTIFGGNGVDEYSAFHWAQKAQASSGVPPSTVNGEFLVGDGSVFNANGAGFTLLNGNLELADSQARVTLDETDGGGDARYQLIDTTNAFSGAAVLFEGITGRMALQQTDDAGNLEDLWINMQRNGAVQIYHNNIQQFATSANGVVLVSTGGSSLYMADKASANADVANQGQLWVREGSAGDPLFSEVELLADMDGADGATSYTEISNNGFSAGFNGNAELDTSQFNSGTASLLLDGTGDWMSYADNVAFDMGTDDWTVEGFVRFNSLPPSGASNNPGFCLFSQWGSAGSDQKLSYHIIQDGFGFRVQLRTAGGILEVGTISGGISTGVWYHWAVTRSSGDGNVRAYFNGNYETADFGLSDADMGRSSEGIRIGSLDGTQGFHDGWIDDVRYTVGTARYSGTGSYSVPSTPYATGPGDQSLIFRRDDGTEVVLDTAAASPGGADTNIQFNNGGAFGGSGDFTWDGTRLGFTNSIPVKWEDTLGVEVEHLIFDEIAFGASPVEAQTVLYVDWDGMAGDTTFDDDDGNTWTQRNASAVISSFAKFGTGAMVIQGGVVGGFGSPDPSFANFTGDFSFGFWYYLDDDNVSSSFTGGNTIFGRRNSGDSGGWRWRVLINNGNLSFNYRVGSPGSENRFRQFGPATVREQWLYCVVERDGGVIRAYVGGSQVGSDVNDSDTLFMGGGDTQVSAEGFSGIDDDFYVDDITILDGATVYAGGGGGEPPGDPANPSGDFETFVVGDPVYRTLIDGEDVFLGKQSEQVARTTDAASGGFLVNNTLTGSGFERVLTRSDVGGGSNDGDMIEWDDTAGEFVVSPTVAAADHGITVFGAGAGGVTNTRIEFRDGLPGSTRNFYIGPVGSNQVDIVSENVAGRSIRIAGDDGSLVQRVGLNFVPGSTTVLRATTQLILQSNDGTKVFDGSASGSGSVWSGGAEKITAFSDGAVIRGSAANSVNVRMAGSGGSTLTQIRHNASNTCLFDNTITNPGVAFRFQGEDVATITRTMMEMNPNTGPSFFESGVEVARVLPAASGGFEVNNTLTGAGFERVITESDFGAGEVIEKVKNVSTTRSSTGVSDDPELSGWALTAGYWRFYGSITFTVTPSNGGIDLNWSTIGGSLGINFGTILTRDDTGVSVGGCIEGAFIPGNVSDLTITYATRNDQTRAFIHGQIEVASGTVTVGFQWAPRLAASQTVGEGSWIRFQKTN